MHDLSGDCRFDSSVPQASCCTWDGRLDNRRDLLARIGLPAECADGRIALELYQRHGVDGLRELIGDWSACIWDAPARSIVLASDYAGIRPLYFRRDGAGVAWSSSLRELVRQTGANELDEVYAASWLLRGSAPGRTPYAGIEAVPPGHAVVVTTDGVAARAFWKLPSGQETRYQDERDYEARMLELFEEAVRVRTATNAPVCAELSGGLDSSSVVCMAARLGRDLHTFSYTHERNPDERYFREVERACGLEGCHLQLDQCPPIAADQAGAAPGWWVPRFRELARRMEVMGSTVLLTGQFGDLVTGNTNDDSGQAAEWLAKGRAGEAAREAYRWAKAMQAPIYPILWRSVREAWFGWTPPVGPQSAPGAIRGSAEDSVTERLRNLAANFERERAGGGLWRQAPAGRRRLFRAVADTLQGRLLQAPEALQHVSFCHPFAHRPLVEFLLTIPARVVVRPGAPRRLLRRAFAELLPPPVLARKSKAAYTSTYGGALRPLAAILLRDPSAIEIVERGFVEPGSLRDRLKKFTQGLECNEPQLRQLIVFEFWLRNSGREESGGRSSETW